MIYPIKALEISKAAFSLRASTPGRTDARQRASTCTRRYANYVVLFSKVNSNQLIYAKFGRDWSYQYFV